MKITPEQEAELRKEYPKFFRLQKRLFPEKKPDPREREILKRIHAATVSVDAAIARLREIVTVREDSQQPLKLALKNRRLVKSTIS